MAETLANQEQASLPEKYEAWVSDEEKTGIRLFGLKDKESEVTTYFSEFNKDVDVHAVVAWAGAKTSRSEDNYEDIFAQIHKAAMAGRKTAGAKLSEVFVGYGHASVADMAPTMIFINDIPMHEAFWMFNHTSVGGGQELSTRYVKLDDLGITNLSDRLDLSDREDLGEEVDKRWAELQEFAADRYNYYVEALRPPLREHIRSELGENEWRNARRRKGVKRKIESSMDARILDVARMWIPSGAKTSMTIMTSVRNVIDISGQLRSARDDRLPALGDQLVTLLELKGYEGFEDIQAELGGLTRSKYFEGTTVLSGNIDKVREYADKIEAVLHPKHSVEKGTLNQSPKLEESSVEIIDFATPGDALLFQYLTAAFPEASEENLKTYVDNLNPSLKKGYGEIIFNEHTHHELMRNLGDVRGTLFSMETAIGYERDLNRQRAFGRYIVALETDNFDPILRTGFNMNHQIVNATYWQQFEGQWRKDAEKYQRMVFDLDNLLAREINGYNSRVLQDILPLGQQTRMHMSGPPTQMSYMTNLRIGLGGDFGYRKVVWDMLEQYRDLDPVLAGISQRLEEEPDVNDVEQILGRS